jgi:hypothetical protein
MARRKQNYLKGSFSHRRTEGAYMGALLEAVTLDDWRDIVAAAVTSAKSGDSSARAWLAQYLVGKPALTAPAPLTVVVQQLSGHDPLTNKLANPVIESIKYPGMDDNKALEDRVRARIADELKLLEANSRSTTKAGNYTDGEGHSAVAAEA